jgi:hypothetical protein
MDLNISILQHFSTGRDVELRVCVKNLTFVDQIAAVRPEPPLAYNLFASSPLQTIFAVLLVRAGVPA